MPHLPLPSLPLGQTAATWMTSWLTPIWYLAAGTALGLLLLFLSILLFRLLASIPAWDKLSRSPFGHVVAAVFTAALALAIWFFVIPPEATGDPALQEPFLLATALVLVCSIAGWAIVFCSSKQPARNSFSTLGEGVAGFLRITALVIVFFGLAVWGVGAATGRGIVARPIEAFTSIPQVFTAGEKTIEVALEATEDGAGPFVEVNLPIDIDVLQRLTINTSGTVVLADAADSASFTRVPLRLLRGESVEWRDSQDRSEMPIPHGAGQSLFVQNREIDSTLLSFNIATRPLVPQAYSLLTTAAVVLLIGLAILLQQAVAPRASAVAHATLKNELAQPLFVVLMLLGTLAIFLYVFLSFNTFGEDIKLLKECGIMTIMLLAAFQGIWSASSSVSEEIEGKTALTVLSKPIQRRSFIIGKFMGIFWVLLLMFVILGTIELGAVAYKPIYDAREASQELPSWEVCHGEMMSTVPGLAMAFMQAVVLTAISVALATRIPQLANLAICFSIYIIGNLSTVFVSSTQEAFDIVKFIAQLIATIIPILEHFQLQAAIDAGNPITMSLLSGNLLYCLLYVMLAMFLALLLFEDRDLA